MTYPIKVPALTPEQIRQIRILSGTHMSMSQIASAVNCSRADVKAVQTGKVGS